MKNILIVEDSSMTRSMIRSVVEELDQLQTFESASGFEALKMLSANEFDMIITDINMPDINGLELINFVRKDSRHKEIPLIIVSTEKSDEDKKRGMAIGASAYITKPFKPHELKDKVKDLLKL